MPIVVLSQPKIAALPAGEYLDPSLPNFGVRVGTRRRVYFVRVRETLAGKVTRVRVELGTHPRMTLKAAKVAAADKLRQHDEGVILRPPIVPLEALAASALSPETITVGQLVEIFLGSPLAAGWSWSHKSNQGFHGRRIVIPALGSQLARTLGRHQIQLLVAAYAKRAPLNANRLHAFLSKLCRWSVKEGYLPFNPMDQLSKPTIEASRERELRPVEIVQLWTALDAIDAHAKSTPKDRAMAALWRLRLLTAQREQSLRRLEWTAVNLDDKVIEIPGAIMKGQKGKKRSHVVPLGTRALAILQARKDAASPLDRFVFGSRTGTATAPGRTRGVPVALEDFKGHDLRRTATTLMTSHGITAFVAARVLAHKDHSVTGIYNRYEYLPEKRVALELLDRLVTTILETDAPSQAKVLAFVRA